MFYAACRVQRKWARRKLGLILILYKVLGSLVDLYKYRSSKSSKIPRHHHSPPSSLILPSFNQIKMKFLVLAAALTVSAMAMPEPVSGGNTLNARDKVKLNQYKSMDDW
jgi:hypothetical protein